MQTEGFDLGLSNMVTVRRPPGLREPAHPLLLVSSAAKSSFRLGTSGGRAQPWGAGGLPKDDLCLLSVSSQPTCSTFSGQRVPKGRSGRSVKTAYALLCASRHGARGGGTETPKRTALLPGNHPFCWGRGHSPASLPFAGQQICLSWGPTLQRDTHTPHPLATVVGPGMLDVTL